MPFVAFGAYLCTPDLPPSSYPSLTERDTESSVGSIDSRAANIAY